MAVGKDTLRRFIFEGEDILGSIVRLDDVWDTLRTADNYPSQIEPLVGEAAAAAALLGRSLKFDGRLTFQVQGAEHLRLLVMQTDNKLNLRGIARYGDKLPEYFTELVEGGLLTITIESDGLGGKAERYQSVVPLSEKTLADCLGVYYRQSVQLPTVLLLDASNQRAAGLMLQAMPERSPAVVAGSSWSKSLKAWMCCACPGWMTVRFCRCCFPKMIFVCLRQSRLRSTAIVPMSESRICCGCLAWTSCRHWHLIRVLLRFAASSATRDTKSPANAWAS